MGLLTRDQILKGFEKIGLLALNDGQQLQVYVIGGAAMVLGYDARQSTHDIDAIFLPPPDAASVRKWAKLVAAELKWPDDWINDAAKGYLVNLQGGTHLLSLPGIEVWQPVTEQLLAMKLCAWRDDVDIADAQRLLSEFGAELSQDDVWNLISPFLLKGRELKAQYAFLDLWESRNAGS